MLTNDTEYVSFTGAYRADHCTCGMPLKVDKPDATVNIPIIMLQQFSKQCNRVINNELKKNRISKERRQHWQFARY